MYNEVKDFKEWKKKGSSLRYYQGAAPSSNVSYIKNYIQGWGLRHLRGRGLKGMQ